MISRRWFPLLPALLLASTLLIAGPTEIGNETDKAETFGANADLSTAPRVNVDRPKPTFPLYERNKRVHGLRPFQALVDAAPAGSVLRPPPGIYAGPVELTKPLTIEGGGRVTIDSGDKGTVFSLVTNNATLRGLHLTGSGDSHDTDDSCLDVRGHNNNIEQLVIDNCLFGIDLKQSNDNTVKNNKVRSKPIEVGIRGDGLRLWYSHRNLIEGNEIVDSRDMVAWYSNDNTYRRNLGMRSRYSIHFMFAKNNTVEYNRFYDNAVGVYFMYTEGGILRNNLISHATGATGMAIGFKEASNTVIEGNEIVYCAVGIGSDLSPFQPDSKIWIRNNRFAFNGIAMQLTSELGGNIVTDNVFEGNLTNVVQAGRGKAGLNEWRGNFWDDYLGFDRNHDGQGDTPYELYAYADQIWIELPAARFFKTAPVLELLDFLERLAPFSSPELTLKDEQPRFVKPKQVRG
ncbi:MAG: nitrous oxide reductase family maturation protein NosD [Rhodoferax sp.]|nr:nitrous oxide reductase family maturation protein NosD [Rhodoferax sp.]MDP3652353.1 nitrous oxide reductase family maturation protein NosD [Rhodoferax sp.]